MRLLICLLFSLSVVCQIKLVAQSKINQKDIGAKIMYDKQALNKLRKDNRKDYKNSHNQALKMAKDKGWSIREKFSNGRIIELQRVDELGNPIYYTTYSVESAATTSTDALWDSGEYGLSLSGGNSSVKDRLGLWDGGPVKRTHQELTGRVSQQDNAGSSYDDHSTHVSGIMIGRGVNKAAKGMAYQSNLKAWDWNNDLSEMSEAAADGLLLSNHSYGLGNIGWVYNPDRNSSVNWEWWGDTSINSFEDYRFGYYDSYANEVDKIAINAPYYLIVVAAGNDRGYTGPGEGNKYYLKNTNQTSTLSRRSQDSFDLITSFGLSKNVLTVGAIHPLSNGFEDKSSTEIAYFSSWGPPDDGRVKPDIVADGWDVLSSIATSNGAYDLYSGTSMAAPNVTGSLQLLQEYFAQLNQDNFLKAATLKGVVIQTSDDAGNPGPDYTFGWGVLNMLTAAKLLSNEDNTHLILERDLAENFADTIHIVASGTEPLKVTLSWNDPSAKPLTINSTVTNNRTSLLSNDLDIRIVSESDSHTPWRLDPDHPANPAVTGDNRVDNVEQVILGEPVSGKSYSIIVSHKDHLSSDSQEYSLIMSGVGGSLYCASEPVLEDGSTIDEFHFSTLDYVSENICNGYTNLTNQFADILIRQDQDMSMSLSIGSCETQHPNYTSIYIDWNADFDFDDEGEQIITVLAQGDTTIEMSISLPENLKENTFTRGRVITSDTIVACGTYNRGETLDFSVKYLMPTYDVAPVALVSPNEMSCSDTEQKVSITIINHGTEVASDIPVTLVASTPENLIPISITETYKGVLAPRKEGTIIFENLLELLPETTYKFQIYTALPTDQYHQNDSINTYFISKPAIVPPAIQAFICDSSSIRLLSNHNETFWYADEQDEIPLGYGSSLVVNELPADSIFYASINDLNVHLGPKDKYEFNGGGYGAGLLPEPLLTTKVPLIIESARLYIGNSGKLKFNVLDDSGSIVSSSEMEVSATRDSSVSGDSEDDMNDLGTVYPLDLEIPTPGTYRIQMVYDGNVSIYRSNQGVTGFPYTVPNVVSLTGSLFESDTITDAYYYLYDINIRAMGCQSQRTEAHAQSGPYIKTSITAAGPTTVCNESIMIDAIQYEGATYQWEKDSRTIETTSNANFEANTSGIYRVIISNDQCVYSPSNSVEANITTIDKPKIAQEGDVLMYTGSESVQWYLDDKPIESAIDEQLDAKVAGYYTVEASRNNCHVFSDPLFVYVEPPVSDGLWAYPNPVNDILTIRFRHLPDEKTLKLGIWTLDGKKVANPMLNFLYEDIYQAKVDVSELKTGIYLLKVSKRDGDWNLRFIKK